MTVLVRGQKLPLGPADVAAELYVGLRWRLSDGVSPDTGCFGLDAQGRLGDDRYLVFYNQPASPEGAVRLTDGRDGDDTGFLLRLDALPPAVDRLVVTVAVDPPTTMAALADGVLRVVAAGRELARFPLRGSDFSTERAVVLAEVYRRQGWRLAAVGQGVDGGLAELVTSFGGSVEDADARGGSADAVPAPLSTAAPVPPAPPTPTAPAARTVAPTAPPAPTGQPVPAAVWGTPLPLARPSTGRPAWGTPVHR